MKTCYAAIDSVDGQARTVRFCRHKDKINDHHHVAVKTSATRHELNMFPVNVTVGQPKAGPAGRFLLYIALPVSAGARRRLLLWQHPSAPILPDLCSLDL